ncbi:MAG: hypothetical protein H0X31_14105, partial [Nostocaceae cyanobacterium]|nr:hypothetical protein [Nostocaceae cyanobacterium]
YKLITTTNAVSTDKKPIPLGIQNATDNPTPNSPIDDSGVVNYYPYDIYTPVAGTSYNAYSAANRPRLHLRSLWFSTINGTAMDYGYNYPLRIINIKGISGTDKHEQPLLAPVVQLQYPTATPGNSQSATPNDNNIDATGVNVSWIQKVTAATETNLIIAHGNTPARPSETNGGLENFVRYLEVWNNTPHSISGSFIQFKRSLYATAPWQTLISSANGGSYSGNGGIFGYPQTYRTGTTSGETPFYTAPNRQWGFDVALLTQLPDLFSQRFTAPPTSPPNEYYREVGRDDRWITTLLCAATSSTQDGYESAPTTSYGSSFQYAISKDQRPQQCQ